MLDWSCQNVMNKSLKIRKGLSEVVIRKKDRQNNDQREKDRQYDGQKDNKDK